MANNSIDVQANFGFKTLLGKALTDHVSKGVGNEAIGSFISVPLNKVFTEIIDISPAQAITDGTVQLINAELHIDPTSNNHAFITTFDTLISPGATALTIGANYYSITSTVHEGVTRPIGDVFVATSTDLTSGTVKERITDIVDARYGIGYTPIAKIGTTPIPADDPKLWFFIPDPGIFYQEIVSGGVPTNIDVYQYIGETLEESLSAGGDTLFNWDRTIKALPQIGVNYGGVTIGEGLEAMFFPFLSSSLSLNGFGLAEVGDDFAPQLIGSLNPNDETIISNRRVFVGGVDTDSFATNSINQAAPSNITTNTTYQLRADVDDNGTPTTKVSPTRTQSFIFPFFFGMSADSNLNQGNLYSSLTKLLQGQGNKTVLLNGSTQTIYFAYDSNYPDLSQVIDNNGFNVTNNFTKTLLNVDSVGQAIPYTKEFKVYKSAVTTVNNANFQFRF